MTSHTDIRNRQPKGIPVGGQFATSVRAESGATLTVEPEKPCMACTHQHDPNSSGQCYEASCLPGCTGCADLSAEYAAETETERLNEERLARQAEEQRWGTPGNVSEGSRTPWGSAQYANHIAPGVVSVGTAGHGGVKVSPERNALIPPALRNASGWYEEDCEVNIVAMYHPEVFAREGGRDAESIKDSAVRSIKNWFPDAYTKATGEEIPVEESSVLRDRAKQQNIADFRAEHSSEFVTLGNGDTHAKWIPEGYASCLARVDDTGEARYFLMPRDEVIHNKSYGRHVLADPSRHLDVTDIHHLAPERDWPYATREVGPLHDEDLGIDLSVLTASQRNRAIGELAKRWRFTDDDGTETVETLGEHMARIGVTGKKPYVDGHTVTYGVNYTGSRLTKVSKATYDALTGVPEVADEVDLAHIARTKAEAKVERLRNAGEYRQSEKFQAAEAAAKSAGAKYQALSDAKREDAKAWQAERDAMQIEAMSALLAERGIEI